MTPGYHTPSPCLWMCALLLAGAGCTATDGEKRAADSGDTAVGATDDGRTTADTPVPGTTDATATDSHGATDEDTGSDTGCTPGQTGTCPCPDDVVGVRRCSADGTTWGDCACTRYGHQVFVRPDAVGGDGSQDAPFGTLEQAQEAVRQYIAQSGVPQGGIAVWLGGGTYQLDAPLAFTDADAGAEGAPVVWQALPGETPRISGGTPIDPGALTPVSPDDLTWDRLDPAVREHVVRVDLATLGITDYGTLQRRGFCGRQTVSPLELFVDDVPMTLARWPDVPPPGDDPALGFATISQAVSDTVWTYDDDRVDRWATAPDVWFHGWWKYAWADCRVAAASIDPDTNTVTLRDATKYGIAAGQPWYAFNILEEITVPGEWYLDRDSGVLYLYPPGPLDTARIAVSMRTQPLVTMTGTAFIELRDVTVELGRSHLVEVRDSHDVLLDGVTLRNAGGAGAALSGTRVGIRNCQVHHVALWGVSLSGGDRPSLTAGDNFVENCDIHHFGRIEWTYRPGVSAGGVGHHVRHNAIHDGPHSAILYSGNEHDISYNDIHRVCQFSSDAGAIYSGRDWGARGNVIAHNFIHDIHTAMHGYGAHGIYLDDCLSGVTVFGNLLYDIQNHAIQHGGGRDNHIDNNVIARCGDAITADSRCHDWRPDRGPNNTPGDSWNLLEKLQKVGYQDEPWASAYPECAAIPNDWNAIIDPQATWLYPEGCTFTRNAGADNGAWMRGQSAFDHYAAVEHNLENAAPLFVDEANGDLRLNPDSPAFTLPGFQDIPFEEIGIQR